jgi:nitrogen regulatory protein PII
MKLVTAFIKPFRLDEVQEALAYLEIRSMAVGEVRGYGGRQAMDGLDTGELRLRVEVTVPDDKLDQVLAAFEAARTGHSGDGLIFVVPLDAVVTIRTGETRR